MKADYHVHTDLSDDSQCPMREMVARALELGLDEIAITEHVDYDAPYGSTCDYEQYFSELSKMRAATQGRLRIRAGMEFGVQVQTIPLFERDFREYPFDFILLSNHQTDGKEFWTQEFQAGKTQDEYQRAYYEAILYVIRGYKNYSVLAHLDMIKRYDRRGDYPDEKILDIVEAILRQAIADGKGIEFNTSFLKYGLRDTTPSRAILRLYRDLGGEILTLGSDAHDTARLAERIEEMKSLLRGMGFSYFCTFEAMRPIFHRL